VPDLEAKIIEDALCRIAEAAANATVPKGVCLPAGILYTDGAACQSPS
jgi:hypothetical protein